MTAFIDPTAKGRYPVVLGDGMLDGTSNDIYTGIRYNHKPTLFSSDAPAEARLKPSLPGKTASYDLSYTDGGSSYAYTGTRNVDESQYVLHFDPKRKVFILDKVDSTFNMNVTRLPGNSDPAKLARQYPHLDTQKPDANKGATDGPKPKPTSKPPVKNTAQQPKPRRKTEKKQPQPQPQPQKDIALSLPKPELPKPPKQENKSSKRVEKDEEDEEDDDGDGDLLIEYPGGNNATAKLTDFSPAFPTFPLPPRFDDFMDQRDSEGDADGESDDDIDHDFKLPSPVNHNSQAAAAASDGHTQDDAAVVAEDEPGSTADMEDDLEKEMEIAFGDLANSQEGSAEGGDESEISEED